MTSSTREHHSAHEKPIAGGDNLNTLQKALSVNVGAVVVLTAAFFVVFYLTDARTWLLAVPAAVANLLVIRALAITWRDLPAQQVLARWITIGAVAIGLLPTACLLALVITVLVTLR